MKTLVTVLAFSLATAAPIHVAGASSASAPPRVEGQNCAALAAAVGGANIWIASFRGQKTDLFDYERRYAATACFNTEAECKAWLYWAQSDWPEYTSVRWCEKGVSS